MSSSYSIRQFAPADVAAYRTIRLEALELEPSVFGNSFAMELAMTDKEWLERLTNPRHARFGLYCNQELIGLTAIIGDANDKTLAYMTQSYIRQQYRGNKLSRMLYNVRLQWARANGIERLTIGHRCSNVASKAANQRYGFLFTHAESRMWPDGTTDDFLNYELRLTRPLQLLFVCTINRMRSATAEVIFSNDARFSVKSAGTDSTARAVLSEEMLLWADAVVIMEKHHRNYIRKYFPKVYATKKIVCLYIPDEYDYMQPELVALLQGKVDDAYSRGLLGHTNNSD